MVYLLVRLMDTKATPPLPILTGNKAMIALLTDSNKDHASFIEPEKQNPL